MSRQTFGFMDRGDFCCYPDCAVNVRRLMLASVFSDIPPISTVFKPRDSPQGDGLETESREHTEYRGAQLLMS